MPKPTRPQKGVADIARLRENCTRGHKTIAAGYSAMDECMMRFPGPMPEAMRLALDDALRHPIFLGFRHEADQ